MRYEQSTGRLTTDVGELLGTGYAGHGAGRNNPAMQDVVGVGPLPQGWYTIGPMYDNPHTGRMTMNLEPDAANEMFGRALFRMHGDNAAMNHTASDGCIIMPPQVRETVNAGPDKRLEVVA